jgi:hypothetical protein
MDAAAFATPGAAVPDSAWWTTAAANATAMNDILLPHLQREDDTVTPAVVNAGVPPAEQQACDRHVSAHGRAQPNAPVLFALYLFSLPDDERAIALRELPCIVRSYLLPKRWRPLYQRYIQFFANPLPEMR